MRNSANVRHATFGAVLPAIEHGDRDFLEPGGLQKSPLDVIGHDGSSLSIGTDGLQTTAARTTPPVAPVLRIIMPLHDPA